MVFAGRLYGWEAGRGSVLLEGRMLISVLMR